MQRPAPIALALTLSLLLAGCGGSDVDDVDDVAKDPGGSGAEAPNAVPAAPGEVRSRNLVTVMDTNVKDDLVELCLGPIAESYPPQCGGPAISNWDWKSGGGPGGGYFEQQGDVRWGTFAVTGTWDGAAFTVTDAIPGALYDPMPQEPPVLPEPSVDLSDGELQEVADAVSQLPGIQGAYADTTTGHVLTDVTYDDGTYQDYLDEAYGADVVVVTGALVDVT